MPSRKSQSSETHSDSRRSSLRRLSSIASLQTLNPFNRRRSNNNTTNTTTAATAITDSPSTASNLSLASTPANVPDRPTDLSTSHRTNDHAHADAHANIEDVPPLPAPNQLSSRRSSYVCLPDDPIGGMPRSRTFSNLPLPARAKKSANPLVQSRSHARLPSVSRIPTPTTSSRSHATSTARLESFETQRAPPPIKRKLIRSDTEPLLQNALEQTTRLPRSTAFKENLSLSPIKPLPSMLENSLDFGFSRPSRTYTSRHDWSDSSEMSEPAFGPRKSSLPLSTRAEHGGHTKRLSQKFDSSPAYISSRERAPTPGQPVQRWNSQPVFTNTTNLRSSHGEIKQTRLMSERGPPTPPPPKTPLGNEMLGGEMKRANMTAHLRQASEQTTPLNRQDRLKQTTGRARADSLQPRPPGAVTEAQPLAYWTGRFSTLNDRYRNEELAASSLPSHHLSPSDTSKWYAKKDTDQLHTAEANTARMRRAIEHLYSLCLTEEAKHSFLVWQKACANALGIAELGKPVHGSESLARNWNLEMSLRSTSMMNLASGVGSSGTPPSSESRKMSLMDRLLGRRQKSAALLSAGA